MKQTDPIIIARYDGAAALSTLKAPARIVRGGAVPVLPYVPVGTHIHRPGFQWVHDGTGAVFLAAITGVLIHSMYTQVRVTEAHLSHPPTAKAKTLSKPQTPARPRSWRDACLLNTCSASRSAERSRAAALQTVPQTPFGARFRHRHRLHV